MRSIYRYSWGVLSIAALLTWSSCSNEQEVSAIVSPNDFSTVTITPSTVPSLVNEGDTLKFTLTVDKMFTQDIDFSVLYDATSEGLDVDYEVVGGTFPAYTLSTEVSVIILEDNFPEMSESLKLTLTSEPDYGFNFQLSPSSESLSMDLSITNVNNPDALTVSFAWDDPDHESDFDFLVESLSDGSWSTSGATGSNPETDMSVDTDSPDGTYYFGVDPYSVVDGDIAFTVNVGHPDGTVEVFSGAFNTSNLENYTTDLFSAWDTDMYRMVTVVKSGDTYTVTYNDEY